MNYRFNQGIENLHESASLVMMEKARAMKAQGIHVISLAGGEPDFDTPPAASYAGIAGICKGHTHYTAGRGIPALRNRIAKKLREENNLDCETGNIVITPGGKYAIYLAVRTLVNAGDEVMILDPSYVSYAPIAIASGAVPVSVGLEYDSNYEITLPVLEKYVTNKTRLLIVNSPNNPTGRVITSKEVEVITEFANKHDLMVISDEVYEKLIFDDRKHICLGSIPDLADRVVTINCFSKSVAMTGWRLGYFTANKAVVDKMFMLFQHTISCISEFAMEAAAVALDCNDEIMQMIKSYEMRRNYFVSELNKISGVECRLPEGAFYAWARINRDNMSSEELCEFLLDKAKVVTMPGPAYGLGGEKCLRMSFANSQSDLEESIARISKALQ